MARPATSRLKVNPPLGSPPTLEWRAVGELLIDPTYQRSIETGPSQSLIRKIAMFWDWGLCQPLAVSRRPDGSLTIVDGQHRASAAKLRGDIPHLPCVITSYANCGDEAAAFVALNQMRRPLSALDLFKAAVAAEDAEALAVLRALDDAGLRVASSTNLTLIKPGALSNIGGLLRCYRRQGEAVFQTSVQVLAQAYPGEVMRYAGSIFPGIAAVVADEFRLRSSPTEMVEKLTPIIAAEPQRGWYKLFIAATTEDPNLSRPRAAEKVVRACWRARYRAPLPEKPEPPTTAARCPRKPLSFEEQIAAVESGKARVVTKVGIRPPNPEGTLGGVTGEINL